MNHYILQLFAFLLLVGCSWAQQYPEVKYNIKNDVEPNDYEAMLKEFKSKLCRPGVLCKGIPLTIPYEGDVPTSFIDIVITSTGGVTRVRFRRDSVYLIGWRDETDGQNPGPWFDVRGANDPVRIPNSLPTGFQDGYDRLGSAADRTAAQTPMSFKSLEGAVESLRRARPGGDLRDAARGVLTLALMIPEAIRSNPAMKEVSAHWYSGDGELPPWLPSDDMIEHINLWETASGEIMRLFGQSVPHGLQADFHNELDYTTDDDIVPDVGILCSRHPYPSGPGGSGAGPSGSGFKTKQRRTRRRRNVERDRLALRSQREIAARDKNISKRQQQPFILPGRPLVEIYGVVVNKLGDGIISGTIGGSISAKDSVNNYNIWANPAAHIELSGSRAFFPLNGPDRSISGADQFTIYWQLGASPGPMTSSGDMRWSSFGLGADGDFDKVKYIDINLNPGEVEVWYNIMSNAAEALIDIIYYPGGKLNGQVLATAKKHPEKFSYLLNKDQNESFDVGPRGTIPLDRRAVAVPLDSMLNIAMALNDVNKGAQVVNYAVDFVPKLRTPEKITFPPGNDPLIEIQIQWV